MRSGDDNPDVPGRQQLEARDHRREVIIASGLALFGFATFVVLAIGERTGGRDLVAALAAFALVFVPYPLLSVERWRTGLARWIASAPFVRTGALLLLPLAAYAAHSGATRSFSGRFVWTYVLYAGLPAAFLLRGTKVGRDDPTTTPLRLLAAVLVLWLPLDLGWLSGFQIPAGAERTVNAAQLIGLDIGLLLFTVVTPVRDVGFCFRLRPIDVRRSLIALAGFAIVAIPLGVSIDFIRLGWPEVRPLEWTLVGLSIYLMVAVPEEFLFRGLLQNLLGKRWQGSRGRAASLLVASVIFGAAHINNPPVPNYRYASMATLAGVAYGWVWLRTRRVTASAITHAGVDWIWLLVFRG